MSTNFFKDRWKKPTRELSGLSWAHIKQQDEENIQTPFSETNLLGSWLLMRMHVDSKEFDKRAVAVMHELLIFTLENRLATTDHLTHFRREFVMPQKLMRFFLKYCGIFYISERGKRSVCYLQKLKKGRSWLRSILWYFGKRSCCG